ncbi:MAG: hypothetical protein ACOC85_03200 [Thermoplasmatota archaeon]
METQSPKLKNEFEEKLMEAKVYLSETRYTNIDIQSVKEHVKEAVSLRKKGKYEEGIKKAEEAIETSKKILEVFEKLIDGKKIVKKLKNFGVEVEGFITRLKDVKNLADRGFYEKANSSVDDIIEEMKRKLENLKVETELTEEEKLLTSYIPGEGITLYSLGNEIEGMDESKINELIDSLEEKGLVESEKKGRWRKVYLIEENETLCVSKKSPKDTMSEKETGKMIREEQNILVEMEKDEIEFIYHLWKDIISDVINDKTREILGWKNKQKFLNHIFRYGMMELKEDPIKFVREMMLIEYPIVENEQDEELIRDEIREEIENFENR